MTATVPPHTNERPAGERVTPTVSPTLAAWALTLLLGLQPATTDLYLPALPALREGLTASMSQAQLTLSALMLAFGVAQLFWGPVSDRYGRRPVLLTGLLLYTVSSVGGALAGNVETLVLWRTVQGAALAAAVVCARALVRDVFEPQQATRVMSLGLSGLGMIAILSPLIGGFAAQWGGWRLAFALLAALGTLTLGFIAWRLPETVKRLNPLATSPGPLVRQWARIALHREFVAWTLLVSFAYGGLFTLLAGSSFVFIGVWGFSPGAYGLAMASGSVSYVAGTFLCRYWLQRGGRKWAVKRGAFLTLAGGSLAVIAALPAVASPAVLLVAHALYLLGHGIHQPCGQAGAVGPFPHSAGAASALAGFVLALLAFVIGLWLGWALSGSGPQTLRAYSMGLGFWSMCTALTGWILVQRIAD